MEEVIKKAIEGGYREDIVQIHKNMKQEIEQIIKNNLPEKKENPKNKCINAENHLFGRCFSCEKNNGFNDCLDEINTSLIADEVLRVVVEKIQEDIKKIGDSDIKKVGRELWGVFDFSGIDNDRGERLHEIIGKMLISSHNSALNNLLSNISPNKENKNNG